MGESLFTEGDVNYLNLAINPQTNKPYVAYQVNDDKKHVSVMYYTGNL